MLQANDAYEKLLRSVFSRKRTTTERCLSKLQSFLADHFLAKTNYPIIQIIGTNGKGSTASFLESMFHLGGYKTGMFTSPHLHRFEERFRINRRELTKESLYHSLLSVLELEAHSHFHFPFFDLATIIAIHSFNQQNVDIAIMEAGMGGSRDATTALPASCVVFTSIGLDHQQWLGTDKEAITREKVGAFKPHLQVISGVKEKHLSEIIERAVHERKSRGLWQIGRDFSIKQHTQKTQEFSYKLHPDKKKVLSVEEIELSLHGDFQRENFSLAASAFCYMEHHILKSERPIPTFIKLLQQSAKQTKWPGRLQKYHVQETTLLLDGAHNAQAMVALRRNLPDIPFRFLFGCSNDKSIVSLLAPILESEQCQGIYFCRFQHERAASYQELEEALTKLGKANLIRTNRERTVTESLALAMQQRRKGEYLLVTGSLFVVSEAIVELERNYLKKDKGKSSKRTLEEKQK